MHNDVYAVLGIESVIFLYHTKKVKAGVKFIMYVQ